MFWEKNIDKISINMLHEWRQILLVSDATPLALIYVINNDGIEEIHACITEHQDLKDVINMIKGVVIELEKL